jgi:hypothetical protein
MAARGRIGRIYHALKVGVPVALALAGATVASTSASTLLQAGSVAGQAPVVVDANGGFEWG